MNKRLNAKRVILFSLLAGTLGVILVLCVFVKTMGGQMPDILWVRQRELQFCPRCGLQRWEHIRGFLFGLRTHQIEEKPGQSPKIAGIDRANCDHLFYTVAMDGKMLVTRGFRMQKFTIGQASGDAFWDEPLLVDSFRAIEKDDQGDAFTLFQFLVNERQRAAGLTNVLQAMKGTNSQALIDAMHQIYTNGGRRLPGTPKEKQ